MIRASIIDISQDDATLKRVQTYLQKKNISFSMKPLGHLDDEHTRILIV